jgi:Tyrosine-protein kinase ephrin type A/B receptor-like
MNSCLAINKAATAVHPDSYPWRCAPGYVNDEVLICKACQPGTYWNFGGCKECDYGTYSSDQASMKCLPCPAGTIAYTGQSYCYPCSKGCTSYDGITCACPDPPAPTSIPTCGMPLPMPTAPPSTARPTHVPTSVPTGGPLQMRTPPPTYRVRPRRPTKSPVKRPIIKAPTYPVKAPIWCGFTGVCPDPAIE